MYARPDDRRFHLNATGLTGAIAINGAVLAALFLAAPEILTPEPEGAITIRNIPIPPPPEPLPEPEPQPRATAQPAPQPLPHVPPSPIPLPPTDMTITGTTDFLPPVPPLPFQPGQPVGTGTNTLPVIDPPPAPVLTAATRDPRFARDFQPAYPPSERRAGREGTVTVRVRIDADGRVADVLRVAAQSDAFFDATRRQALSRWRFRPATLGTERVESWQTLTVRFVLDTAR